VLCDWAERLLAHNINNTEYGVSQSTQRISRLLQQAREATEKGWEAARKGDFGTAREWLNKATELTDLARQLIDDQGWLWLT
jgi:hypothetical protein